MNHKKVAGDREQALQRERQELQVNFLCLSVQVSSVNSLGLLVLETLWKGVFPWVFHLPCGCTGAMGCRGQGVPLCGKVMMLQEWGVNPKW